MAFPTWTFARAILFRSFVVWAGIRAILLVLGSALGGGVRLSFHAAVLLIVVVAALTTLEGRRRNEHVFLANLRVPTFWLVLLAVVVPALLEILIAIGVPA